jgi:tetratricopeptide (TPR) repeat protein
MTTPNTNGEEFPDVAVGTPSDHAEAVGAAYVQGSYEAIVTHVGLLWDARIAGDQATAGIDPLALAAWGECCRYAMVASAELGLITTDMRKWKAYAHALYALAGYTNGVALLLQSEGFGVLGAAGIDHLTPEVIALSGAIFDEMEPLISPDPPEFKIKTEQLCRRIIFERRGLIALLQERWSDAVGLLDEASRIARKAGDERGELKPQAHKAMCTYQLGDHEQAIAELEVIIARCEAKGSGGNLVDRSRANLAEMRRGGLKPHFVPIDVI